MKQIKLFFVAMIALVLSSCEAPKWSLDSFESVAVYELKLTTLIDLSEASSVQIQYIDIYPTLDFVLESTDLSSNSGLYYKYEIENYCDYSTDTEYNITFNLQYDEDTVNAYSIFGDKSTAIVTLTITNGGSELYNQADVTISEVEKMY